MLDDNKSQVEGKKNPSHFVNKKEEKKFQSNVE